MVFLLVYSKLYISYNLGYYYLPINNPNKILKYMLSRLPSQDCTAFLKACQALSFLALRALSTTI